MTDIFLYNALYEFLLAQDIITIKQIKFQLKPESNKPKDLREIFKRLCFSAQNRQMSVRVIGSSIGGPDKLAKVLSQFNPHTVVKKYSKGDSGLLFEAIKTKLKPTGQLRVTSRSIWPNYCETIIQAAHFLAQFQDGKDFFRWVHTFTKDPRSVAALPQVISTEIDGIGFPLACDFLKEIGCLEYGKPDVHVKKILSGLGFIEMKYSNTGKENYETFKVLNRIASNNQTTAFEVDKLLWLIGSGRFYNSGISIGRKATEFISYCKKQEKRKSK
jgi:hypothetical protein